MITFFEWVFWGSIVMLLYVYIGYSLCLKYFILYFKSKDVQKDETYKPMVTILIAAHNEEDQIEGTIRNKLSLEYPEDKLQLIVISDYSDDKTDDIVRKIMSDDQRIELICLRDVTPSELPDNVNFSTWRRGKTAALNEGMKHADGDIIVFSDANSRYSSNAIGKLVCNLADRSVGYVTGKMEFDTNGDVVKDIDIYIIENEKSKLIKKFQI